MEQLLSLSNTNLNSSTSLMKFYLQTRKFDDNIDYELILSIVKYVCQTRPGIFNINDLINNQHYFSLGHIVVFLPSPDEISTMIDLISKKNFLKE